MTLIAVLLSPFWRAWRNDLLRSEGRWWRRCLLCGFAAAFWFGIYEVVRRVLVYFQSVYDLGPSLAYQLLLIIMLTFLSMLLFSNLIASLSAFFLARDLDFILSAPVPAGSFFYARLATTALDASWMVLFFSIPIFMAYGAVFGAGLRFYLWTLLVLPLFLTIPAALGVVITHLLVYWLPAKRIRDVLLFLGLTAFVVIYFLFRFAQPERLVHPESFGHFMQFLSAMETPSSALLPSSWSVEVLAASLFNRETDQGFSYLLLLSYALFLPLAGSWISGAVYLTGWSKAQESRLAGGQSRLLDACLRWLLRPFPDISRPLIVKDIKAFLRDSTQWSQLFLLAALVVVYLYNFKVLPLDRSPAPTAALKIVVAFANLGLAGFVLSAVAMRFAFPAVSLEGKAFWLIETAPIPLRALFWSKFWVNFIPLLLLGELLVLSSNWLLQVPAWMTVLSMVMIVFMTAGVTAIGIGVGALYPKFTYDHAAQIPTSFGGAVCMIFSVAFVALLVLVEAWPIYIAASRALVSGDLEMPPWSVIAPPFAAVVALAATAVTVSAKLGLNGLDRRKQE